MARPRAASPLRAHKSDCARDCAHFRINRGDSTRSCASISPRAAGGGGEALALRRVRTIDGIVVTSPKKDGVPIKIRRDRSHVVTSTRTIPRNERPVETHFVCPCHTSKFSLSLSLSRVSQHARKFDLTFPIWFIIFYPTWLLRFSDTNHQILEIDNESLLSNSLTRTRGFSYARAPIEWKDSASTAHP